MRNPLHLLALLVVCLCVTVVPAAAQQGFAFEGIAWRLPADSVRARLERLGYTFSRDADEGDPVFTRADRAELTAIFQDGRAVGFLLVDSARARGPSAATPCWPTRCAPRWAGPTRWAPPG